MVDLDTIRTALHAEPFRPFDFCLADGRHVAVKHPEYVAMSNRIVVVLDEESYSTTFEPLLIVSLEPHRGPGKGRNGSQGKKRKP